MYGSDRGIKYGYKNSSISSFHPYSGLCHWTISVPIVVQIIGRLLFPKKIYIYIMRERGYLPFCMYLLIHQYGIVIQDGYRKPSVSSLHLRTGLYNCVVGSVLITFRIRETLLFFKKERYILRKRGYTLLSVPFNMPVC